MAKKTILLVEDDRILCDAISKKLDKEGYQTVLAYNGEEGLRMVAESKPDLILLDVLMPKMNGLTMLEKLRETDEKTPVIILTNFDDDKKVAEAVKNKAAGYLLKSNYSLEDIIGEINKNL